MPIYHALHCATKTKTMSGWDFAPDPTG